jgi:hypothetical protein
VNDALSTSMFWVGAMFAFTPIVVAGTVIAVVWWKHRRNAVPSNQPDPSGVLPDRRSRRRIISQRKETV